MEASILDLRYRMKDVLSSLDRNEQVKIYYHGKLKGTIHPWREKSQKKVKDDPFFGMIGNEEESVDDVMKRLRGARYVI